MSTKIEWTDEVWNPVTGCDRVSPGCDHCYAERWAQRFNGGDFSVAMHTDRLLVPFRWRKPRKVFVNSMSDLFHPGVLQTEERAEGSPAPFLATVFAVMAATPQHTYQVLTKRPQMMSAVLNHPHFRLDVNAELLRLGHPVMPGGMTDPGFVWPSNIWCGVSVENQRYADLRIPHLLATPAAVRFLSCEPLLGAVDLKPWLRRLRDDAETTYNWDTSKRIDWVIVGGESGPGARPMHPDWPRKIRDECQHWSVPLFMKQAGAVLAREWGCAHRAGGLIEEWPEEFRVREWPDGA